MTQMSLVVQVCFMLVGNNPQPVCHEEIVAQKETEESPEEACLPAQQMIAKWKENSRFAGSQWTIGGYKCVSGVPKEAI